MDFDPDRDPLLDDDETLDFVLYREMERESARPPRSGCLGVVLLLLLPPATLTLLGLLRSHPGLPAAAVWACPINRGRGQLRSR